ncbi:unnamed protein product, partial [Mesorhabditis belari]|uniref:Uncharacterized protein n=1 Tax=Mesorhabditis belari TaxID=2138241 RepID=A0AAF3EZN4_9BILA
MRYSRLASSEAEADETSALIRRSNRHTSMGDEVTVESGSSGDEVHLLPTPSASGSTCSMTRYVCKLRCWDQCY